MDEYAKHSTWYQRLVKGLKSATGLFFFQINQIKDLSFFSSTNRFKKFDAHVTIREIFTCFQALYLILIF